MINPKKATIIPAFGLHDESIQHQLSQIGLFQDSTIFVAAPDHPLAALKSIVLQKIQLKTYAFTNIR